jgi:hypothetical protein
MGSNKSFKVWKHRFFKSSLVEDHQCCRKVYRIGKEKRVIEVKDMCSQVCQHPGVYSLMLCCHFLFVIGGFVIVALRQDSYPGAEARDSGGTEEEAITMDDDAPSTPTGLTVGGVDPARGSAAAGGGPEMDRKDRVYKKGPWNVSEMLVLQSAKKEDVVRAGKGAPRDKHRTAQEKWQSIEDYCWAHFVQRSAQQCQDKWESMSAEFKKVKDCECGILSGQRSYWQMSMDERKAFRMPPNFQKEVYQGLQEWYDKNRAVEPGEF